MVFKVSLRESSTKVEESDSTNIRRFKISVNSQIRSRWHLGDIDPSDIKVIAAALHP